METRACLLCGNQVPVDEMLRIFDNVFWQESAPSHVPKYIIGFPALANRVDMNTFPLTGNEALYCWRCTPQGLQKYVGEACARLMMYEANRGYEMPVPN